MSRRHNPSPAVFLLQNSDTLKVYFSDLNQTVFTMYREKHQNDEDTSVFNLSEGLIRSLAMLTIFK